MKYGARPARLLPWTGSEGKPCYLLTDGDGPLSRLADVVEATHLDMAEELSDHAAALLADARATPEQLRFMVHRMREALTAVRRVAESRGMRSS
ncbi:hypothetical protein ACFW5U_10475 [Streptomyces rochei]|uniref:Uncharacterized protein n=1 Tax=Streptomyces vinaceusdrappus TaxID=67376 RepID=A0ABY6BT45_9ACTN|nr:MULTISPECIES: hypothetical protein [Streptomyces]RIH60174.1 hypothetical protein D3C59_21240 [Streptomyces sp. SHP22-7]KYK09487.1 hypothetical protein AUW26_10680 [Streptomyces sp. CC71]NUV92209.1 hypothetical protein [Streptomyces sp. KAI 90]UAX53954.1 hypothetical protein K5X85_13415 [Streptomyces sp. A144]UXI78878.1 hypothetical protein N6Q81_12920 [Streptomyces vinaceusdrappus]